MNPINKYLLITVLFSSIVSFSFAQNLDEIITKHLAAHGDMKKLDNIESMKITGLFTAFSIEDKFFAIKTKNGEYYCELTLGKHKVKEGFDGIYGWTIDPWQEILFPRELNKTEQNVFVQKAEFITPFYKYKEKGCSVELLGEENVDGIDTYVLKLTRPSGAIEKWYINSSTYLEYKSISGWTDFAQAIPAESFFDDFRDFDGIIIPCFIERTFWQRDRVLIIDNIEFNIDVDENLFTMPKSDEIQKLDFLIGEWGVAVESWSRRGNRWYTVDSTTSTIMFEATNLIQEKIRYNNYFVQSKITNFSYNSSLDNYLIVSYDAFSSTFDILTGHFTDSTFVVENEQIGCDTTNSIKARITYSNISKSGFGIEVKQSYDDGNTWHPGIKMNYFKEE